jgi:hypothetical protein
MHTRTMVGSQHTAEHMRVMQLLLLVPGYPLLWYAAAVMSLCTSAPARSDLRLPCTVVAMAAASHWQAVSAGVVRRRC